MGSLRRRNSRRAREARTVNPTAPSHRRLGTGLSPTLTEPCVPTSVELAIENQRESIGTAISLLYCLHSALRSEIEDSPRMENEAVADAAEWADVTVISGMLLVRLHAIHSALDFTELVKAKVDPEMLRLSEMARDIVAGGEGDSQP